MRSALGLAAAAVLLCAVVTLWRRSLGAIVRALAVQGVALACVATVIGLHEHDVGLVVVGLLVLVAKAVVVPILITRVVRHDPAQSRDRAPRQRARIARRRRRADLPRLRRHAVR